MKSDLNLLLLAGSREARQIAVALPDYVNVEALLSEPERGVTPMPVPVQLAAYKDAEGFERMARGVGFDAILDASHGFDAQLTAWGFATALALNLPYLRVERPPWSQNGHIRLKHANNVVCACAMVPPGTRVFATTGWDSQAGFAAFPGDRLLLRQTRRHDRPPLFDFIEPVFGLPPFSVASETQLFEEMGVDMLIARNLGGQRSRPKLDAALALGLEVVLVNPPDAPAGAKTVDTVDAALAWVAEL